MLTKLMSSKFPLVVILAEVAAQLRLRGMDLQLEWIPREENDAADALTNYDFGEFSEELRVPVTIEEMPFEVLQEYLTASEALYQEVQSLKAERKKGLPGAVARKAIGAKKLRETDPW